MSCRAVLGLRCVALRCDVMKFDKKIITMEELQWRIGVIQILRSMCKKMMM